MNISQWLLYASDYLKSKCQGAGRIDAELLLAHCLEKDRVALYRDALDTLTAQQQGHFLSLLERRGKGEPLAYITSKKEFMGNEFFVRPGVLIPRPDTELMVERVVDAYIDRQTLVDVGTGSGAIVISLALLLNWKRIYAIDISQTALEVARYNAFRHGLSERIEFLRGDLLAPIFKIKDIKVDFITANLPYIPSGEIPGLMPDVKDYEPLIALDGGQDGLDFYRRLILQAREILKSGAYLLMEIASGQGEILERIMTPEWSLEILKDLAGRERLVVARRL
ncbi:MAG: peptide chain release factor N(5)-glutamine methyltransferase [Peptococcaceae bacterium]|nr:peptide chain release factor N(5)-glutamine methyltransferase [Peptococcaceae bacterium]